MASQTRGLSDSRSQEMEEEEEDGGGELHPVTDRELSSSGDAVHFVRLVQNPGCRPYFKVCS